MNKDKSSLGTGLDSLLGDRPKTEGVSVTQIPLDDLTPGQFQPRTKMHKSTLEELSQSIKEQGILQPLIVRRLASGRFEIVVGERRWRAAQLAGISSVPAIIRDLNNDETAKIALIENLQREDLNAVEEAKGLDRLKREFGLTQDEVATSTGKARSTIANSLRILSLPQSVLEMLSKGIIEKGHAKLLASLTPKEAEIIAKKIAKESISIKELSLTLSSKRKNKSFKPKVKNTDLLDIEREMSEAFGHKIEIETRNKNSGKVSINYSSLDELDNIISKIKNK